MAPQYSPLDALKRGFPGFPPPTEPLLGAEVHPLMDFFAQSPEPLRPEPARMQSPALADKRMPGDVPALPPSPLERGAGPRPVEPTPGMGMLDVQGTPPYGLNKMQSGVGGEPQDFTADFGRAPFRPSELEGALSGLRSMESSQNIPGSAFGPMELNRLANRDPRSVQPGSNQIWQGQLQEEQARSKRFEQPDPMGQMANAAIAGLHPAIQEGAEREAGRKALPAQITGNMQLEAAKVAGASRYGVGESNRMSRNRQAKMQHMDAVMNAIRGIQGKANVQDEDLTALSHLRKVYEALDDEINADEDFEDQDLFRFEAQ